MRLLVDTHAALWLLAEDKRLSSRADELLTDANNEVLLSAAVVWEVAIKRSLGKLNAPDGFARQLLDGGAVPLPVSIDHARAVRSLPWHHRDPFDRLLVAQASLEDAILISNDQRLRPYGVRVAW
ncbi:MAG TPA: type II toxin-antitoxin system VapC family toxin [Solirubrobacteraceae bacterium]|nr:type II toxin-antitoxin system VapC family toxin [Solirubrobacteraceae bacterium]